MFENKSFQLLERNVFIWLNVYYIALVNNRSGYYLCTFLDTFFLDVYIYVYCGSYQTLRPFYIASLVQCIRALLLSTTMIGRFLLNF